MGRQEHAAPACDMDAAPAAGGRRRAYQIGHALMQQDTQVISAA